MKSILLALLFVLVNWNTGSAATFIVSSLADSGTGSLRQAVLSADSAAGEDEIVFTVTGTITLTSGEIPITAPLKIAGPGAGALTVSGNDQSRIFLVQGPAKAAIDVTLSGLTLTRGRTSLRGGAVAVLNENLTILDSVISNSRAGRSTAPPSNGCGGNVALREGTLRIVNTRLTGGTAEGIGASTGGNLCAVGESLSLERATLSGGTARQGGGLYFLGAWATIHSSTFSGNTADSNGGGVYIGVGDVGFLNSTISGNTAGTGGGLYADNTGDGFSGTFVTFELTTLSHNTATEKGGSLHQDGTAGGLSIYDSIVANGTPEDIDLSSGFYVARHSLIEAPLGPPIPGTNNILGVDPRLGPLANNGGPTMTHAPLPGSPVIGAGNPALPDPPTTDQRGFPRTADPAVDMGSVETPGFLTEVPTLSEWSILALSALLVAAGMWKLRGL
jgi:hypothetical protein